MEVVSTLAFEVDCVTFTRKCHSYPEEIALGFERESPDNSMLAEGVSPCYCVALKEIFK